MAQFHCPFGHLLAICPLSPQQKQRPSLRHWSRSAALTFFSWRSPMSMGTGSLALVPVFFRRFLNFGVDLPKRQCAISTLSASRINSQTGLYSLEHNFFLMYVSRPQAQRSSCYSTFIVGMSSKNFWKSSLNEETFLIWLHLASLSLVFLILSSVSNRAIKASWSLGHVVTCLSSSISLDPVRRSCGAPCR